MIIGTFAQIAVCWENKSWTYYPVEKTRIKENLISSFRNYQNFSHAIVYEYDKKTEQRGKRLFYFSLTKIINYL